MNRKHNRPIDDIVSRLGHIDIANKRNRTDPDIKIERLFDLVIEIKTIFDVKLDKLNQRIEEMNNMISAIHDHITPLRKECPYIN